MPYARRRKVPELNQAYAYVVSDDFAATAQALRDKIVAGLGFTAAEAEETIQPVAEPGPGLFAKVIDVVRKPRFAGVPDAETQAVRVLQSSSGEWSVELRQEISPAVEQSILAEVPIERKVQEEARIAAHNAEVRRAAIEERCPPPFSVPQLYVTVDGQQELFTVESARDAVRLELADVTCDLERFDYSPTDRKFQIDFLAGRMDVRAVQTPATLLPFGSEIQDQVSLVRWLNEEIRNNTFSHAAWSAWINGQVSCILRERGVTVEALFGVKFALARFLRETVEKAQVEAEQRGYQELLNESFVPELEDRPFRFQPEFYNPPQLYRGTLSFDRHISRLVGAMNQAETSCAAELDRMDGVVAWVRNIEKDQIHSFKLPTMTDYFYPDFVASLTDGRVLVVEYKGEVRDPKDAKEKEILGRLWEARSGGRGVFAWVESFAERGKSVERQLREAVG